MKSEDQPGIGVEMLNRKLEIRDWDSMEQAYLELLNEQESAKMDIGKNRKE